VATVTAELFGSLKGAPFRITTPDVPVPYSGVLETRYVPTDDDIVRQLTHAISTGEKPKTWWQLEGIKK
jgi:pyruvate dehydrogenase E1 component beta subunit